jgi:ParB family chromosome partitioning protein
MITSTATEYRNLPLAVLTESTTNPRRIFEDSALKELAESIRSQGVLSPLLVRPLTDQTFEIVAGARRYRAAQIAEAPTVPVRIVNLTDAEALEAQLIENLQRRDVHPMEEAQGPVSDCCAPCGFREMEDQLRSRLPQGSSRALSEAARTGVQP